LRRIAGFEPGVLKGALITACLLGSAAIAGCRSSSPQVEPVGALSAALHASPSSGPAPLAVSFSTNGTTGGTAPLHFDYDFDGDGTYDLDDGGTAPQHSYATAGTYHAGLRVSDSAGHTATAETVVAVTVGGNALPTAVLAVTPANGNSPLAVMLDGSGSSDNDGTLVRYDYDIDNDGIWDAYDAGPSVHWTFQTHGDYVVKLRVTDDRGGQATTTRPVHVNAVPNASLHAVSGPMTAGSTVTFDASDSLDLEGPIVKYEWDADGNGSYEINGGTTPTLQIVFPTVGTFHVGVRVTDSDGATNTANIPVQITN